MLELKQRSESIESNAFEQLKLEIVNSEVVKRVAVKANVGTRIKVKREKRSIKTVQSASDLR